MLANLEQRRFLRKQTCLTDKSDLCVTYHIEPFQPTPEYPVKHLTLTLFE